MWSWVPSTSEAPANVVNDDADLKEGLRVSTKILEISYKSLQKCGVNHSSPEDEMFDHCIDVANQFIDPEHLEVHISMAMEQEPQSKK